MFCGDFKILGFSANKVPCSNFFHIGSMAGYEHGEDRRQRQNRRQRTPNFVQTGLILLFTYMEYVKGKTRPGLEPIDGYRDSLI